MENMNVAQHMLSSEQAEEAQDFLIKESCFTHNENFEYILHIESLLDAGYIPNELLDIINEADKENFKYICFYA